MKNKIQIGIPCGRNSENYVAFLISSINKTISKDSDYEFILGVNQKGVDVDFLNTLDNAKVVIDIDNKSSSTGHGICLDLILKNMNSRYGMFVDSDVAFLKKNWDKDLLSYIDNRNIIVGTEYHPTDGKIVDFPNVITCIFDVKALKDINLSFVPKLTNITTTEKNSKWFGVNVGSKIFLDTGCHIPEKLGENNYTWKTLKIVTPRYEDRVKDMKFMLPGMRGEEYQLNGVPICTHIGRSLTRDFKTDNLVLEWKKRVTTWLNEIDNG